MAKHPPPPIKKAFVRDNNKNMKTTNWVQHFFFSFAHLATIKQPYDGCRELQTEIVTTAESRLVEWDNRGHILLIIQKSEKRGDNLTEKQMKNTNGTPGELPHPKCTTSELQCSLVLFNTTSFQWHSYIVEVSQFTV